MSCGDQLPAMLGGINESPSARLRPTAEGKCGASYSFFVTTSTAHQNVREMRTPFCETAASWYLVSLTLAPPAGPIIVSVLSGAIVGRPKRP